MTTYYVIRRGWNSANQSSMGRNCQPRDTFASGLDMLVAIVDAESEDSAKAAFGGTVYNNQILWVTANPRSAKGLARAIRDF